MADKSFALDDDLAAVAVIFEADAKLFSECVRKLLLVHLDVITGANAKHVRLATSG